ncbi:MAG: NUDIX domain-containing protein, partial [Actinobacteria bacterium]|nr:NUDIX domain-containing protein [Actinomycetota bacterium]
MVEAYLAGGPATPAVPRYAATVMLVRPAPRRRGSEVFMLRRAAAMAFAAGAMVFPGGRVDDSDSDAVTGWAGPSPQQWAQRMDCPVDTARAVVTAAVRELFEETGVLLAGSGPGSVVRDLDGPQWAEDRVRLAGHELSMGELAARRGLVLRTDLLGLRSHWLTPEFEPRRYDTYFFAAAVPEGQNPASCTTEASEELWARPHQLFVEAAVGRVML